MLKINQTYVEDFNNLEKVEKLNHKDAFEFLPEAKNTTYQELSKKRPTNFLSIKVTDNNGEEVEKRIIDSHSYLMLLACTNRVFERHSEYQLVSVSYKAELNQYRREGIFVNALVITKDDEELSAEEIKELETELAIELKICPNPNEGKEITDTTENTSDKKTDEGNATEKSTLMESENETADKEENNVNKHSEKETEEEYISLSNSDLFSSAEKNKLSENIRNNINNHFTMRNNSNIFQKNSESSKKESMSENSESETKDLKLNEKPEYTNKEKSSEDLEKTSNKNTDMETIISTDMSDISNHSENEIDEVQEIERKIAQEREELLKKEAALKEKEAALKKELQEKQERIRKEKEEAERKRLAAEKKAKEEAEKKRLEEEAIKKALEEKEKALNEQKEKNEANKNTHKENEKILKDDEEEMQFIKSFYDGNTDVPASQITAYNNASDDAPFLNSIDNYVSSFDIRDLEGKNPIYELHEEDEFIQTSASKTKIKNCFNRTMTFFMNNESTSVERTLKGELDSKLLIRDIQNFIERPETGFQIPAEDIKMLMNKIQRAIFSYYVLTPAINDENVSDIRVLAPDNINVKVHGKHYTASDLKFIDANDYIRFIENLLIKNNIHADNPILVFTDRNFHPDYILRFNICLPVINSTRLPYLHIRKVPKEKTTLKKLMEADMLDAKVASYLLDKVKTSRGIVFSGPSASGKTTLMNALIDYIPKDKSILCIQESEELFSEIHPNAYFQHMLKGPHGEILIGLSELGQNGLLCDAGYFIIGECKGSEVRDLLRASNTGHKCWCSVHAQSSIETIPRLADYVKYGSDYSLEEATRMLKDLEVIVYIQDFKVKEISEIAGYDEINKKIIYRCIYKNPYFN